MVELVLREDMFLASAETSRDSLETMVRSIAGFESRLVVLWVRIYTFLARTVHPSYLCAKDIATSCLRMTISSHGLYVRSRYQLPYHSTTAYAFKTKSMLR